MGNFNRDNRSGRGRDFRRGDFGNRSFDRPTMHQATCDKCGKPCEVPFVPTNGKPVYCSNCFESMGSSDSRRSEGRNFERPSYEEKRMFDAVCSTCGNSCKVPFQPRGDKPIYCSNCFGKNEGGERNVTRPSQSSNNPSNEQFQALNVKLDKILKLLSPDVSNEVVQTEQPEEVLVEETESPIPVAVKTKKPSKKKAPVQDS